MLTKVIRKLTVQNILQNKKRSVATIIGIMLSCALICAVAGSVTSVQATLIHYEKESDGDYHAKYMNVPGEGIQTVRTHENVSRMDVARVAGYAHLPGSINPDKPYLHILSVTENAAQVLPFHILEGRFPENESELMIADHVRTNGGLPWKIGDTISLDVGSRRTVQDAIPLLQKNPYDPETCEETLADVQTKSYTIVGIMNRPGIGFESITAPGYTAFTGVSSSDGTPDADAMYYVMVSFSPVSKAFESEDALYQKLSETYPHIARTVNKTLIDYEGGARKELMDTLEQLAAIIILVILLTSVFVIRNSFQISVSEKVRQYGILASVGATSKQIEKSVLYEGFLLGAVGIPAGILLGVFAVRVLMWITDALLGGDMLISTGFVFRVSYAALIVSVLVSVVTIFLSCLLPARRAGRMSAMEAIRGNRETKDFQKIKRSSNLIKRLFGIGGVIASNSLQRSRKKYRTTVVSLVVSTTVFIAMSWFTDSLGRAAGNVYADMAYNFVVSAPDSPETYQDLASRFNLTPDHYNYEYGMSLRWDTSQYGSAFSKKNMDPEGKEIALLIFLNRDYFKIYAERFGITQNLDQAAILVDCGMQTDEGGKRTIGRFYEGIAPGDEIVYEIPAAGNEETAETLAIRITDYRTELFDLPMGSEGVFYQGGVVFVSEDYGKEENLLSRAQLYNMQIHTETPDEMEKSLMQLKNENKLYAGIFVQNIAAGAALEKRLLLVINIFLYGFITVITLIGITNVFNTITTNMLLRAREFAMLKSIGMTSSQFRSMIFLESALYGTRSLMFGIPLGTALSYLLYTIFSEQFDMGYRLPLIAILISVLAIYAITGLTMWYSMSKINSQNTIDVIRAEAV